jgi:hypothetical protein
MANGKLDLNKDLKFGTMNAIEDTNVANSGDRRRTSSLAALNNTTSRTYGKNSLRRRQRFNGIVVHKKQVQTPRYQNRASLLSAYVASQPLEAGGEEAADGDSTTGNAQIFKGDPYTIYKVYVPELEPRPAPKSFTDPVLHTYPDIMATAGREDLNGLPLGAIVQITYEDPNRLYNPQLVDGDKSKFIMMAGYEEEQANVELMFAGGVPGLLGHTGECSEGEGDGGGSGNVSFTWSQLISLRPAFAELLEYIAAHESRGNYNAVNRGVGGDTPGGSKKVPGVGKDLTEMTIGEVLGYMKGGANEAATGVGGKTDKYPNGSVGFLATGKYQLIPVTLNGAVRSTGVDKNKLYNKETQEVFGVYLLLKKRPVLGRYLLGMSNDVCLAAQKAALEWASLPLQYARDNGCQRGYSAYCKGGANATEPLSRSPDEVVQILKQAREAVRQNSVAVKMLGDKGYKSEFVA